MPSPRGPLGAAPGAGAPSSPAPLTPRPAKPRGPLDDPYSIGGLESITDVGSWQLWWDFNKDPYLGLDAIDLHGPQTSSEDFFLGQGQQIQGLRGGRATADEVRDDILPALYTAMRSGGKGQFGPRAMMAIAKSARDGGYVMAESLMRNFLKMNYVQEDKLAALSLGILEEGQAYPLLKDLAFATDEGVELNGGQKVKDEVRAFAAYGLGLLGRASESRSQRVKVVGDLVRLLEDEDAGTDIHVAAMISIGLVPLEVESSAYVCVCGVCEVEGPETSLQSQVTYLMRYFTAKAEFSGELRGHAASSMARLLEHADEREVAEIKEAVAALLIDAVTAGRSEPDSVRESSVLALGLLGDADADATDKWIRWCLSRAVAGAYLERRFALISLALVGSRRGSSDAPFAGTSDVRSTLLHHLSGRKTLRPWAALGLGVMGHWLHAEDQSTVATVDAALRDSMRRSKRAGDFGAYSIALGMRQDAEAVPTLLTKAQKLREDAARSYAVIGLGMIGEKSVVDDLEELLREDRRHIALSEALGVALGLLGEAETVAMLTSRLAEVDSDAERCAYIAALGGIGDARSITALTESLAKAEQASPMREAAAVALGRIGDRRALPWRTAFVPGTNYSAAPESLTNSERTGVLDLP